MPTLGRVSGGIIADHAAARPAKQLRPFVARYSGYHFTGFAPGVHRGLPSRHLTIVIPFGEPLRLALAPGDPLVDYPTVASGLHPRAVIIAHNGNQYGIQLALTPLGARSILKLPAGQLSSAAVSLGEVLGSAPARELTERLAAAPDWTARFEILDRVLTRHLDDRPLPQPELLHAWRRIVETRGAVQIGDLAAEVGWSRRHLSGRFSREYGLTPKELARVARFERSCALLQSAESPTLAQVAAICGYYDQAHLAREWNDLAGCPPSVWLATEEFPSVQDGPD